MTTTVVNLRLSSITVDSTFGPKSGQYEVWLIGSGGTPGGGLDLAGNAVIPRRVAAGRIAAGLASPPLQPTSEVTPAGTVYRADLFASGARVPERLYFTVPVSAVPVDATDYVTVVPGTLGPVDIEDGGNALAGSVLIYDGGTAA